MTDLPQPLTPAARRHLAQLKRKAARAQREQAAVLNQMYRECLTKGRRA